MGIGLTIIGTELLTGKRRDAHLDHAITALARRGLEPAWCHYVGDQPERLRAELRASLAGEDIVFCFGGIGATPDDHTRRCAAEAAGVALVPHPEAVAMIEARFGAGARPLRVRMAELPAGCRLIPNPVNQVPGFSVAEHHFVPGFPEMAWPMMDWVLDRRYPHLARAPVTEALLRLPGTSEGMLIPLMERLVDRFPAIRLACLPRMDGEYRETELGLRGAPEAVATAENWLRAELDRLGIAFESMTFGDTAS